MTPIDYFNRLKISRAKLLLVQFPDMPLREIAALLGFNDMYYFSKVFKKSLENPHRKSEVNRLLTSTASTK